MNKKILAIGALVLLAIAVPITILLLQRQQEIKSRAAPATVLSFDPAQLTKSVGEPFTVNVKVDTGTNQIASADILVHYDPAILEAKSVQAGNFLPNVKELQNSISTPGKIILSIYTDLASAQSGQGILAIISFKAKAPGVAQVSFESLTKTNSAAELQNVLSSTNPGSYTVVGGTALPTNTPVPTQPPLAQPTAQPTASPTQIPTGGTNPLPTATTAPTSKPAGGGAPKPTLPVTGTTFPTVAAVAVGFILVTAAIGMLVL